MSEIKIGIHLGSLRQPLPKALETAARLGVHAVELDARVHFDPREITDAAVRQIRKLLSDYNVKLCAVAFHTRRGYNVLDQLSARIDATKRAMTVAYQLGASVVVNQIGYVPSDPDTPEFQLLVEVLSDLGHHANHCGAFLAAETGSEPGEDLARLIAALPEGSLGVTLHPGKLVINNFSATDAVRHLGRHIMYVHATDGVRDLAQGRGIEVPLGRGSVDFPNLLGLLEEHDYRGYFTVQRQASEDPAAEIDAAVEFLRNVAN